MAKRKPTLFSYKEVKEGLLSIPDSMDRFMLAASYANGTRISEIINVKVADIDITEDFVYISTPVLKKKARLVPQRRPPIYRPKEGWLADLIISYVEGKKGKLITYSVRTARRRFNKYFKCTTHSFRHTRATHCMTVLKMGLRMVAEYFKISPGSLSDWVLRYGHLDTVDMETHMKGIS